MRPFLRATHRARLAPVGWVAEPAGVWAGRRVEVVYDPNRHQIALVRSDPGDRTRAALAAAGFRRLAVDGTQEMWVRNLAEAPQTGREQVTTLDDRRVGLSDAGHADVAPVSARSVGHTAGPARVEGRGV